MRAEFANTTRLKHPLVRAITEHVCKELDVPVEQLCGTRLRHGMLTIARHVIWYVLFDIGFTTHYKIGVMFRMNPSTVTYGIQVVTTIVKTPNMKIGKDVFYTPERRKLIYQLAMETRELALRMMNQPIASTLSQAVLIVPVCRVPLDEMDDLAMVDLSTRFAGGWLVEMAEFERKESKYPLLVRSALQQTEEAKFVWVIPTLSESPGASTTAAPLEDSTAPSLPSTTAEPVTDPTTSPEIQKQPSASPTSSLQTQSA